MQLRLRLRQAPLRYSLQIQNPLLSSGVIIDRLRHSNDKTTLSLSSALTRHRPSPIAHRPSTLTQTLKDPRFSAPISSTPPCTRSFKRNCISSVSCSGFWWSTVYNGGLSTINDPKLYISKSGIFEDGEQEEELEETRMGATATLRQAPLR